MGPFIFGFFWLYCLFILLVCELGFAFIYLFIYGRRYFKSTNYNRNSSSHCETDNSLL